MLPRLYMITFEYLLSSVYLVKTEKKPSFAQFPAFADAPARKVLPDSNFDPQNTPSIPGGERFRLFAEHR